MDSKPQQCLQNVPDADDDDGVNLRPGVGLTCEAGGDDTRHK